MKNNRHSDPLSQAVQRYVSAYNDGQTESNKKLPMVFPVSLPEHLPSFHQNLLVTSSSKITTEDFSRLLNEKFGIAMHTDDSWNVAGTAMPYYISSKNPEVALQKLEAEIQALKTPRNQASASGYGGAINVQRSPQIEF